MKTSNSDDNKVAYSGVVEKSMSRVGAMHSLLRLLRLEFVLDTTCEALGANAKKKKTPEFLYYD